MLNEVQMELESFSMLRGAIALLPNDAPWPKIQAEHALDFLAERIKGLKEQDDGSDEIERLEDRVFELESQVEDLEREKCDLKGRIDGPEDRIDDLASEKGVLESEPRAARSADAI